MHKKLSLLAVLMALSACDDMQDTSEMQPPPAEQPAMAAAQPVAPAPQPVDLGRAKFAELGGDYAGAVQLYQNALQIQPGNRDIQLALAECYRRLGAYDQAFAIYASLLKADPNFLPAKEGGAITLISKGDYDTPVGLLDEVLRVDPTRASALNSMGILFTTRNLQKEAQQYFREALKYAQSSPSVLTNIALSRALEGQYKDALSILSSASASTIIGSYDRKRADMNTALVYAASGHPEDALAVSSAYYSSVQGQGLFAKLASDKKEAAKYLHMALADGRTYYEAQWDGNAAAAPAPVKAH